MFTPEKVRVKRHKFRERKQIKELPQIFDFEEKQDAA